MEVEVKVDGLESVRKAINKAMLGVAKKLHRKSDTLSLLVLSETLYTKLKDNLKLEDGNLLRISFDFITHKGQVIGIYDVKAEVFSKTGEFSLSKIQVTKEALSKFVQIEEVS